MNTKQLATVAMALALALGAAACNSDSLTNLNRDPNNPTDAPPGPLFTSAVNVAVSRWLGTYDFGQVENLVQHIAETNYPSDDLYQTFTSATSTQGSFDAPYPAELESMRKVIAKGDALGQPGLSGPATVFQTWSFDYITDSFGDIPYSDALKGDTAGGSRAPIYDTQQSIYAGFFAALDQAVSSMQNDPAGDPGLGSADPIYNGHLDQWIRFANSLHARYALRLVNVDPATASAELQAALSPSAGGVIGSNDDNAQLAWPGDGVSNNPWANNLLARDDRRMSRTLMDSLVVLNDPRLTVFAQPVGDSSVFPNGYGGMPNGLPQDSAVKWYNAASRPGLIFYPGGTPYGTFGTSAGLKTPSYLMTYAEMMFIKAEAAERSLGGLTPGEAATDYYTAITASMNQWGVTDAVAINAYLARPQVAYKGGVDGLKQIAWQKWIALFTDGGQAWSEWRRTCVPLLRPGPGAILNYVPRRFLYSTTEASVNAANLNAAIARQGPDNNATRIYWDSNPTAAPTYTAGCN